jgi:hypothetical protein
MCDGLDKWLHQILMMGMELVPETSIFNELTRLRAWENFIKTVNSLDFLIMK